MIRYATAHDLDAIDKIARCYPNELAWVRRASVQTRIGKREAFVAVLDNRVVGFVLFHARKDGWQTIYDLAVHPEYTQQGVGRALLYAVECPIRLKCPMDNERANRFYLGAGMELSSIESGKHRALNVYELRVLTILCAGNNKQWPEIARKSGMAYGSRHDDQKREWPFFIDINWKKYDWSNYLDTLREYRPVMAMVADYETPEQRRVLNLQIQDLKRMGILRVMVCPKWHGAIAHIPQSCIVAVSIKSVYAGFHPDWRALHGRRVHLLGGVPQLQREIISKIQGAGGYVISTDGSAHTKSAKTGTIYDWDVWRDTKTRDFDYYELCAYSGNVINRALREASKVSQPPLL